MKLTQNKFDKNSDWYYNKLRYTGETLEEAKERLEKIRSRVKKIIK